MITNVHERVLDAPPTEIGTLTDGLASDGDRLWPSDCRPPMRLDRPPATCAATAVTAPQMRRNRPGA
jgi:hypothetical protein